MDYYHYFDGIVLMRQAYREKDMLVKILTRPRKVNVLFTKCTAKQSSINSCDTGVYKSDFLLGIFIKMGLVS